MTSGPVIVCGLGLVGTAVLDMLRSAGVPIVAINDHGSPTDARLTGVRFIRGDFTRTEVLEQAGLATARAVVILTSNELVNISTALLVRRLHPTVRVILRMFNQNLVTRLGRFVPHISALSVSGLAAPVLAANALHGELLAGFVLDLPASNASASESSLWPTVSAATEPLPRKIARWCVPDNSPVLGQSLAALATQYDFQVLALQEPHQPAQVLNAIPSDAIVRPHQELTLCIAPKQFAALNQAEDLSFLPTLRWAGRPRRWFRIIRRWIAEVDLAMKICSLVLLVVLIGGTLTFVYGMNRTPADGLYHTVSLVATGADMHGERYEGWQKVFVSSLRVFGAALLAAFTAIFTNYLLRARLGGALEIGRIPDSGHVVVCGLGNVGFRVVEELLRHGEQVVVVTTTGDRFGPTVRRLGGVIITGDATVPDVLRQARVETARAVVSCTSQDLLNLEVALMVRELIPQQRIVVRLADPALADTLRASADIGLALSVPSLAAPAFVAAVFGDRVRTVTRIDGHLLLVVDLVVASGDPCLDGVPISVAALDFDLKPIALTTKHSLYAPPPEFYRLASGDRLTVATTFPSLERLYRHERPLADWAVELLDFPLSARDQLRLLICQWRGISAATAETELTNRPCLICDAVTRGEAEVILRQLHRENVSARLVPACVRLSES